MQRIFLALLVVFCSSSAFAAAGDPCTLCTGDWGPAATFSADCGSGVGDCVEDYPPDGTYVTDVPDFATLDIIADTTMTDVLGALQVSSGGKLNISVTDVQDAVNVTFLNGQDGVNGGEYDNVALFVEAGAEMEAKGAMVQRFPPGGVQTMGTTLDETRIWTVGGVAPCADSINDVGGTVGGDGSCTGTSQYATAIILTDDLNNPLDGTDEENYLEEAMNDVQIDYIVYFLDGLDAGKSYPIHTRDATGPSDEFGISTDNLNVGITWGANNYDSAAYPVAGRLNVKTTSLTGNIPAAGDTCVVTTDDVLATLGSGGYVGYGMFMCDASHTNCNERPIPLSKTVDDALCDGTSSVGHAALHFAKEFALTQDYVENNDIVLASTKYGKGDKFIVVAPVNLRLPDTRTDGQGNMVLMGDIDWQFVTVSGPGIVEFDGATVKLDNVHFFNCGTDGESCVRFRDMQNVSIASSTMANGPTTGAGHGFEFLNVSGHSYVYNVSGTFIGGTFFEADSASTAMNYAYFGRIGCERIGHTGTDSGDSCIVDSEGKWTTKRIEQLFFSDASFGTNGNVITPGNTASTIVKGVGIYGLTQGGYVKSGQGGAMTTFGMIGRGISATRGAGAGTFIDDHLVGCDLANMEISQADTTGFSAPTPTVLSLCDFDGYTVHNAADSDPTMFLELLDSSGNSFIQGNRFHNFTTSSSGGGKLFAITADNSATTYQTIQDNTISWDSGTGLTDILHTGASTGDVLHYGGNLITGFDNNVADATTVLLNVDDDIVPNIVLNGGRSNCLGVATVSGGGTATLVLMADPADGLTNADLWDPLPYVGQAVGWDSPMEEFIRTGSFQDVVNCGALPGNQGPGLPGGYDWLYMKMFGSSQQRHPVVKANSSGLR